jgi:hypothetical protein
VTCISTCGVEGLLFGTLRSQVVAVVVVQSPAVKAVVRDGDASLGLTAIVIVPAAAADRLLQAAIRYRTVPPAWTLVAEAVTATLAAPAGAVVLVLGVGVGVDVGGSVAVTEVPEPELEPVLVLVLLGVGVGVGVELVVVSVALGELVAWVALALAGAEAADEAEEADEAAAVAAVAEADGLADADGAVAPMAAPVTPLEITNRPVARPTVTGRECADRMRTPCLWLLSRLETVLSGTLCHSGGSGCLLVAYVPIRHQTGLFCHPRTTRRPKIAPASSPSVTSACGTTGPDDRRP